MYSRENMDFSRVEKASKQRYTEAGKADRQQAAGRQDTGLKSK